MANSNNMSPIELWTFIAIQTSSDLLCSCRSINAFLSNEVINHTFIWLTIQTTESF